MQYKYNEEVDLGLDEYGDIVLDDMQGADGTHQLKFNDESALIRQIVMTRVKSVKPDWFYDNVGANLESLLGRDNTKDTAEIGVDLIKSALTYDGFLKDGDIYIKPSPADEFTIVFIMAIRVENKEALVFKINIALSSGINIEEVN